MKILFIIDQLDNPNNGTTISAMRFAQALISDGHYVCLAGCGKKGPNKFIFKPIPKLAFASYMIHSQGMEFSMPNRNRMKKIVKDFDVIHFYMPSPLAISTLKIVQELGIAHTSAFHVQPENITYSLGLGTNTDVNDWIYNMFRDKFYNNFTHIHCPSNFIANELKKHDYTAKLYVISNGISSEFHYNRNEKPDSLYNKFVISMVGRYSNEKRQDLLIDAISKSKYEKNIQLILAGKGPNMKKYMKQAKILTNYPIFKFYSKPELINILSYTDLYVHSADAEIEAISCMEAIACGNVPLIANSQNSATPQFALDDNSLFEAGNSTNLANKIDFWIEHKNLINQMRIQYSKSMDQYRIEHSVKKLEAMFEDAIKENNK